MGEQFFAPQLLCGEEADYSSGDMEDDLCTTI
jgi:hypothetical protein